MGEHIRDTNGLDQTLFNARLKEELALLKQWFEKGIFADQEERVGAELEFHLLNQEGLPVSFNEKFIKTATSKCLVTEAGSSMVEINSPHFLLQEDGIGQLADSLKKCWQECTDDATRHSLYAAVSGLLPSVLDPNQYKLTDEARYQLVEAYLQKCHEKIPFELHIQGQDSLHYEGFRQLIIAATCAFQVHLQVKSAASVRFYNAAQILAGPLMACSANSPFYLGKNLWHETRIPLMEQYLIHSDEILPRKLARAGFGKGYIKESLLELFFENTELPSMLGIVFKTNKEQLAHLRLHNGTVYRWNRPVIGFDERGNPHLRIEYRYMPAGPTQIDMIANTVLVIGSTYGLASEEVPPETKIPFKAAHLNFYRAAKYGLDADLIWYNGAIMKADELLEKHILPMTRRGLLKLNIDPKTTDFYLEILYSRIRTKQTASTWLHEFMKHHRCSFEQLMLTYIQHQQIGQPVHEWRI